MARHDAYKLKIDYKTKHNFPEQWARLDLPVNFYFFL